MKLRNIHLMLLAFVSITAVVILIYYQYKILTEQKLITEQQRQNNITAFNLSVMNLAKPVREIIESTDLKDTLKWKYSSEQPIKQIEKTHEFNYLFDSLFRLHNIDAPYSLDGIITNSGYCQVAGMDMGRGIPNGRYSEINDHENTVCLCHLSRKFSFDLGYSLKGDQYFAISLEEPTIISIILVVIIFISFTITIYALRRQKQITELRESFVNTLSHNFETPIFSISLAVRSIKKVLPDTYDNKADKYLELIASENLRLKNYSEKILHEALINTERLELDKEILDLNELVGSVIESLSLLAEKQDIKIKSHFDSKNLEVQADKTHLFNVFYNILDNSIKYSNPNSEVVVIISASEQHITVKVIDQGIGMSESTLKNIFKKYYRGEHPSSKKGFGLGLSYVRRIIDLHRFSINIHSTLNQGTQVVIRINKASHA